MTGTRTKAVISQGDFWVLKLGPEPPFLRGEVTAEGQFKLCIARLGFYACWVAAEVVQEGMRFMPAGAH